MDNELAIGFRERLTKAFEASDFQSHRSLSHAAGWSESRINRIITGQFDNSKDGPGFFGLVKICQVLHVTTDYLAGVEKWSKSNPTTTLNAVNFLDSIAAGHSPPTIKSLMHAYVRSGHRLEAFSSFMDYCDVYGLPTSEDRRVTVHSVGKKSLSALRMGENNHVILQDAYDQASPEFQEQIFSSHLRAYQAGITVEPDSIDQVMENRPVHVKIDYIRVAMRLKDASGQEYIVIFCELIPQ